MEGMLNGDILEYENIGPMEDVANATAEEQLAAAALLALGAVINLWYPTLMRIRGGQPNLGPLIMTVGKTLGPSGRDWVYRHFFTERYRNMVQEDRNNYVRDLVQRFQQRRLSDREVLVARARARIKWTRSGTAPQFITNNNNMAYMYRKGGYKYPSVTNKQAKADFARYILARKNETQRMFHSELYYEMSPILYTGQYGGGAGTTYVHKMTAGQGPHLYATWITTKTSPTTGGIRDPQFGALNPMDAGGQGSSPIIGSRMFIGMANTCYVFCVNYPFAIMNTDTATQVLPTSNTVRDGQPLRWGYLTTVTNTDMNVPRDLAFVTANNSWTYFTHYQTEINFSFYNTAIYPYTVEILFFKFKADVDAMDYAKQCRAPMDSLSDVETYCNESVKMFNNPDIYIIRRKRINLAGCSTFIPHTTTTDGRLISNNNIIGSNEYRYRYTSKTKYVIKRPILNTPNPSLSENDFFNTYFDRQKGVYCRMFAWPCAFQLVSKLDAKPDVDIRADGINYLATTASSGTDFGVGVSCYMTKKSKWKLDQNVGN